MALGALHRIQLVTEQRCDIAETARKESIAGGRSCTYGNTLFLGSFVDKPLDEVAGDENSGTDRREISSMFEGGVGGSCRMANVALAR